MEEKQLIETVDEQGNVINFELFDIVEVDEQEYALLLPAEREEDDEEFNKVAEYVESMDEEE